MGQIDGDLHELVGGPASSLSPWFDNWLRPARETQGLSM
jgi:hypothetical protein